MAHAPFTGVHIETQANGKTLNLSVYGSVCDFVSADKVEDRGDVEMDLKLYRICVAEIIIFCFYVLKDVRLRKPTNPGLLYRKIIFSSFLFIHLCKYLKII